MEERSYEEKRELFLKAVRIVHERGGDDAVTAAFGDVEEMSAAWWSCTPEEFRGFLLTRAKTALRKEAA